MGEIAGLLNDHTAQNTFTNTVESTRKTDQHDCTSCCCIGFIIGELQGEPLLEMFMTSVFFSSSRCTGNIDCYRHADIGIWCAENG